MPLDNLTNSMFIYLLSVFSKMKDRLNNHGKKIDKCKTSLKTLEDDKNLLFEKKRKLIDSYKAIQREIAEIDLLVKDLDQKITQTRAQINSLSIKPRCTDHAVIRYLERKYGFDFEKIRDSILSDTVVAAMDMGAKSVKADGMTLKITDKCVTTIIKNS